MGLQTARIEPVSMGVARAFMSEFEHLGNVGLGVWHYAMFVGESLTCVLSFGTPCFSSGRGKIANIANKHNVRILQLCRGGTADGSPKNSASKAISLTLKVIQRDLGDSIVVAYADPLYNEVGTIYQAANAIHTGWTRPKSQANYIIEGQFLSGWSVRKRYGTRKVTELIKIDPALRILPLRPKLRYIFFAAGRQKKKNLVREVSEIHCPYPKRKLLSIPSMR